MTIEAKEKFLKTINESNSKWVKTIETVKAHPYRDKLKLLGLRQLDVASTLKIPHNKLSRVLNGYELMDAETDKKITALFNLLERGSD